MFQKTATFTPLYCALCVFVVDSRQDIESSVRHILQLLALLRHSVPGRAPAHRRAGATGSRASQGHRRTLQRQGQPRLSFVRS